MRRKQPKVPPMQTPTTKSAKLGRSLVLAAAMIFAGEASAAAEIKIGGTGNALGTMRALGDAYSKRNPGAKVTVLPSLGSGGGIKAVADGAIDIGVSSRPLKEEERQLGLVENEYARTPFVFAVPAKSKVIAISSGQLADLYSGRTEAWPDGNRVRLVLR